MLGGAVQVDVQLAVRELAPQLVGDVDGERGLADLGLAGHRRHHHRRRGPISGRASQQVADQRDLFGAAGEVGRIGWELAGYRPKRP